MRIVLDTAILVRAHGGGKGFARELLLRIIESGHVLLELEKRVFALARVLRYPRMLALYGLSEARIYEYIGFLREATEIVPSDPFLVTPIRDVNDTVVMQTAIIGEAEVLCTKGQYFFEPLAEPFPRRAGIVVLNEVALMLRLRSCWVSG